MTTILATATFCTFTKNLANVKTEVRVKLKERDDGEMRWAKLADTMSRKFQMCDIKDMVFYMIDGKERARDGKAQRIPSAHFRAAGRTIPGFENLGRLPPHYHILGEEGGQSSPLLGTSQPYDSYWTTSRPRSGGAISFNNECRLK